MYELFYLALTVARLLAFVLFAMITVKAFHEAPWWVTYICACFTLAMLVGAWRSFKAIFR